MKLDALNEKLSRTFTGDVFFDAKIRESYLEIDQEKLRNYAQKSGFFSLLRSIDDSVSVLEKRKTISSLLLYLLSCSHPENLT